jgi:hypothetical protein
MGNIKLVGLVVLIAILFAINVSAIGQNCTSDLNCSKCEKCDMNLTNQCIYQDASEDLKSECSNMTCTFCLANNLKACSGNGYCNGTGSCNNQSYSVLVNQGSVCINGNDTNPNAAVYCGIWSNCTIGSVFAPEYYVGFSEGNCTAINWQLKGTQENSTYGYFFNTTSPSDNCTQQIFSENLSTPIFISPVQNQLIPINSSILMNWNASIGNKTTMIYFLEYFNSSDWMNLTNTSNVSYIWSMTGLQSGTYKLRVHSFTVINASSLSYELNFTIAGSASLSGLSCSAVLPNSGDFAMMNIKFNVNQSFGLNSTDIKDVSINSPYRNATCSWSNMSTLKSYDCNITIWYWYPAGLYDLNVSIFDSTFNQIINASLNHGCEVYSLLSAQFYPQYLYFNMVPGLNNTPSQNPIIINNTGNENLTNISVKAYDLIGWSSILSANFTMVSPINDTSTAVNLSNNISVQMNSSSIISANNNSYINLYFWASVPQNQSAQAYNSIMPWEIQVNN